MATNTTAASPYPEVYNLPPPGDPKYLPLHLFTPTSVPYDPRADPIFRLPSPEVLPSLPLVTSQAAYLRVFCLAEIDIEGESRHELQSWGDEVFEWMIQTTLHNNYGTVVQREFDHYYEEILIENLINLEQARYFGYLYDFDGRIRRHNPATLTDAEVQKYLPDTFFAYIGAVEKTRGKEIALKWLRDLIKPILEYRVEDITKTWPEKTLTRATENWYKDRAAGHVHSDFRIQEKSYEVEDFEWMGEHWETWGMTAVEIVHGMLKNLRRHLRAYTGPSRTVNEPITMCDSQWHPNENVWSFMIHFRFNPDKYYVGVHQYQVIAEWLAVWKAMDQLTKFRSEMFTYALWF
ncbi:hypothetical protein TWF481_007545 [Arthrobotrys musiformis]|uniref:Uncharacterized protein n=1 Tax=Arthrobotrys musiformis TaxID=47236 RepID=A0AAV9WBT0_9PEZI